MLTIIIMIVTVLMHRENVKVYIRSDQISCSVVSDSFPPHESQHARPPCPPPTPRAYPNSCPIESVMPSSHLILCLPLLLLPPIPPNIRVFSNESVLHVRWPKSASASASVLPKNIQGWFPLGWTGLISLLSKGLSRVFSRGLVFFVVVVPK